MFYMPGRSRGLWMIGPQIGKFSGGLANRGDEVCPENLRRSWKFANGRGWVVDSKVNITCINSESDCFYADEKFLDGGGEKDVKIVAVSSTVDCIDKCIEHNNECSYWSVSKNQDNNDRLTCHLRRWKGRLTERKGYISGSLPSACFKTGDRPRDIQSPESSENDISNNNVATTPNSRCIYKDLKFEGGDLKILENIHDYRLCKEECETNKDCFFFTSSHFGCFLKNQNVEIQKRVGFVSGASDAACGQ
jgi:hypothetical protein